jgi:hypothetical protein
LEDGFEDKGQLDREARVRCDRAVFFATKEPNAVIVLAGGKGAYAQKVGVYSLANAAEIYLQKKWAWAGRILTWGCYGDTNTVDEIHTLHQALLFYTLDADDQKVAIDKRAGVPRAVTSWWHAPRVWLICFIIFRKPTRVHMSRTTLSGRTVAWKIAVEFFCLFTSVLQARKKRKHSKSHNPQK